MLLQMNAKQSGTNQYLKAFYRSLTPMILRDCSFRLVFNYTFHFGQFHKYYWALLTNAQEDKIELLRNKGSDYNN